MIRFLIAIVSCCLAASAVGGALADPVMRPPAERLPSKLIQAKAELGGIVARRDMAALLSRVRPETKLDFGGSAGPEGFQAVWNSDPDSRQRLWSTLEDILALPGTAERHDDGDEYCSPYVFCLNLPGTVDPFDTLVVLGSRVAIRNRPSPAGEVLRRVDHIVLTRVEDEPGADTPADWTRVRLANGTVGYISTRWVRSPIDFRLAVRVDDGRGTWWLGYLLAGD